MGVYPSECSQCGKSYHWFSGNMYLHTLCPECKDKTIEFFFSDILDDDEKITTLMPSLFGIGGKTVTVEQAKAELLNQQEMVVSRGWDNSDPRQGKKTLVFKTLSALWVQLVNQEVPRVKVTRCDNPHSITAE